MDTTGGIWGTDLRGEASAQARIFASGRMDGAADLFRASDLPSPTIHWRPAGPDLAHPLLRSFARALSAEDPVAAVPVGDFRSDSFNALSDWSMLLEPAGDGEDFRYLHYGARLAEIVGQDRTGHTLSVIAARHPGIAVFLLALYHAVVARGEAVKSLHAAPHEMFVRQWQRLVVPMMDADGRITRLAVVAAVDNELRAGLEFLAVPVMVVEAGGLICFANRAACRLFGVEDHFLEHMPIAALTGVEIVLPSRPEDVILARNRVTQEIRLLRGGVIRPLEITIGASYFRKRAYFVIHMRETGQEE